MSIRWASYGAPNRTCTKLFLRSVILFERNTKLFEQNTKLFERNTKLFERNTKLFKRNTKLFKRNTKLFERNTRLFKRNKTDKIAYTTVRIMVAIWCLWKIQNVDSWLVSVPLRDSYIDMAYKVTFTRIWLPCIQLRDSYMNMASLYPTTWQLHGYDFLIPWFT